MKWTRREAEAAEAIGEALGLKFGELNRPFPVGLGTMPDPVAAQRRIVATILHELDPAAGDLATGIPFELSGLAHRYQVSTRDELWRLKTIVLALLEHPYFAQDRKARRPGRPAKDVPQTEADLHEWWIQANRLRAMLEISAGGPVSSPALADEMARRELGLSIDQEKWSPKEADRHASTSMYRQRELQAKAKAYEKLLHKYDFERPPMRKNSTVWTHSHTGTAPFEWAPSETELAGYPEWQKHYKRLLLAQLERARSSPRR